MTALKTYWHLGAYKRRPSEYEITTSRLLYTNGGRFEVNVPLRSWYERHQRGSPLACSDWDRFRDPRETTYRKYTELQSAKQMFVDGMLRTVDGDYNRSLSAGWVASLDRILGPARYPMHGLQMVAAYVGSMAPGGRIVCTCLLQAADEIRRIQILSYRMRQMNVTYPDFGGASQTVWEEDPAWQPLRELIERLLVAYDWGEALVALNLVVKPAIDDLLVRRLAKAARSHGDDVLANLLVSINEDCEWHVAWTRALVDVLLDDSAGNRAMIDLWTDKWRAPAMRAMVALEPLLEGSAGGPRG